MLMIRLPDELEKRLEACSLYTANEIILCKRSYFNGLDRLEEKYMNENKILKNNSKSFYNLLIEEFALPVNLETS
jgi:predicted DNA-binding protein